MVYVTLMTCGLPASSPVAHVWSFRHACTVTVPANVPAPRRDANAGVTAACPLFPLIVKFETFATADPDTLTTM